MAIVGHASRPRVNGTEWNESREQEVGCEQRELTKEAAANYVGSE